MLHSLVLMATARVLFDHAPLADVAAAFNQANTTPHFVVLGAARSLRFTGTVTLDPAKMEAILRRRHDIHVEHDRTNIVITAR